MADNDKQRLYRQIVDQTEDHTLLEQMRLHGFWPATEGLPQDPSVEIADREKLEAELEQLRKSSFQVKNWKKALNQERSRRWQESKQRRAKRKQLHQQEQQKRREDWSTYKKDHVVHAGEGVSAGLQAMVSNVEELNRLGLPILHHSADITSRMGIKLSALRWLTYHRKGAAVVHYHRYSIAKKTGGARCISAPKPALAHAQRWILENILNHLPYEPNVHGFCPGRSIVSNAKPHINRQVVINVDVKDFFPSITFRRIKGLFQGFGYSEHVATILSLLCTEPPRVAAEVDGKVYHVALGARILPQGACTSPALTNVLCRRLDRRLQGLASKHGFAYTRYADDLTFSGDKPRSVGRLLRSVRAILDSEGFSEHPSKTRIMRRASRQEVTGIIVNDKPAISRKEIRKLRAILHNATRHGLESQNREGRENFLGYLKGKVAFVCMVDPLQGGKLRKQMANLFPSRDM